MNKIYYLLFLLIGFNLSIMVGFYYFDLVIIMYLVYHYKKIKINKNSKFFIKSIFYLIILPSFISLIYQYLSFEIFEIYSIYIIYNCLLVSIYIVFISNTITKIKPNYNILIFLLFLPIIIAILMFHIPVIHSFFANLYNIEQYYMFNRAAGIWGKDVNQLGYYSSVFIIFSSFLISMKKINTWFGLLLLMISLYAILISGMRTGLAAILITVFFLSLLYKNPMFKIKNLVLIIFLSVLITYVLVVNLIPEELFKSISQRFDFELLHLPVRL